MMDEIGEFVNDIAHDDFRKLLGVMGEEWGWILSGHMEPHLISRVRADLEKMQFIPKKLIATDEAVLLFIGIATKRALSKGDRH